MPRTQKRPNEIDPTKSVGGHCRCEKVEATNNKEILDVV